MKRNILFIVNALITLTLAGLFYKAFSDKIGQYKVAQIEAEFSQLGYLMPRNFEYFVDKIENQRDFDLDKLGPYIEYYKKVTEILPQKADAHGLLGFCYYYAGHTQKAIEHYQKAIEINPHFFWFHYNLGSIYYANQQYEQAIDSFKKAVEKTLESALMFVQFSPKIYHPILVLRSDYSERLIPDTFKIHKARSYLFIIKSFYELKKYDEVIAIANYAYSVNENESFHEFYYFYMGMAFYHKQDYEKAAFFFQKVVTLNAKNAEAFYYLGLSARSLGKTEIAFKYVATSQYLQQHNQSVPLRDINPRLESF